MSQYELATTRSARFLFTVGASLFLFAVVVFLNACSALPRAAQDPYAQFRPAVKQEFQSDFAAMGTAPRYAIDVTVDPAGKWLYGKAQVVVTNSSPDPWNNLVFRLYPMLEQYGAEMTIQSVSVDERPATFVYQADNTAIRVDLAQPLLTNGSVVAILTWKLSIPEWPDDPQVYALFGKSQQMISLPLFYPSLAVYQAGPAVGTGHWWLEEGSVRGDSAFNVASLFVVTATLPADEIPVTSGTLVASGVISATAARYVWVTGPSREFLLHMSTKFLSATAEAYGTRITSYWLPGQEATGRAALEYAVGALRVYSDYFGGYPFHDMRVAPAALSYRGMEYPNVNLLGLDLYNRYQNSLEILVAHEMAHQWWYQIVHNDPVTTPWLDEALAEYSVKLYDQALHGEDAANLLTHERWQTPMNLLVDSKEDVPIDRPVDSFKNNSQYETIIYAKGALFYDHLRSILGEREFKQFLRGYLQRYRYKNVNSNDWLNELETLQNSQANALYAAWVRSPSFQTPLEISPLAQPDSQNQPVTP